MASEDSVEDFLQRALALLAVEVHRIGDLNDPRKPGRVAMFSKREEVQDQLEAPEVLRSCRVPHVPVEEGHNPPRQHGSGMDRVHEDRLVTRLRVDRASLELFPGHLEERPPDAVLRDAESGLDEEAEWDRGVGFDAHVHAALSFNHASQKPAPLLLARQAFLLIACTGRIVTHEARLPAEPDGSASTARYSGIPAYSQILQPP